MSDHVIVPGVGLGEVTAVESMSVGDVNTSLLRIRVDDELRMWVPVNQVLDKGLRGPMSAAQAHETLAHIEAQEAPTKRKNWNQRQRRYTEMLMSNDPHTLGDLLGELAAVLRSKRETKKSLSISEQQMLRRVWSLLTDELALVLGEEAEAVDARLRLRTGLADAKILFN